MKMLDELTDALVRMDPSEIAAAESRLGDLRALLTEDPSLSGDQLRCAVQLAAAAADHWQEVTARSAASSAGYSALGGHSSPFLSDREGAVHG